MSGVYPAVFLDRDGVICKEKSYITSAEQLEIYPFAIEAVNILHDAGWKTIMVTNQSAVARGLITEDELKIIHKRILEAVPLDRICYCPHYYDQGEQSPPYLIKCSCRKPQPGMILKAAEEESIDLERSFIVGDRESDILAGKNAGIKTVLVRTGYGDKKLEFEIEPDYIFGDIKEFAQFLKNNLCN